MIISLDNGTFDSIVLNNYGFDVQATVKEDNLPVNISLFTTRQFIFRKPSGINLTVTGVFVTDGVNGKLKYSFVLGDINEVGEWGVKVKITDADSLIVTEEKVFTVH